MFKHKKVKEKYNLKKIMVHKCNFSIKTPFYQFWKERTLKLKVNLFHDVKI